MWDSSLIFHEKVFQSIRFWQLVIPFVDCILFVDGIFLYESCCLFVLFLLWFIARGTAVCPALFECGATRIVFHSCWFKWNSHGFGRRRAQADVREWKRCWIVSEYSSWNMHPLYNSTPRQSHWHIPIFFPPFSRINQRRLQNIFTTAVW